MTRSRTRTGAPTFWAAALCAAASAFVCGACSASSEGEHTATVVRGTYGDPNPIVACGQGGDAASDAGVQSAVDASPDGC